MENKSWNTQSFFLEILQIIWASFSWGYMQNYGYAVWFLEQHWDFHIPTQNIILNRIDHKPCCVSFHPSPEAEGRFSRLEYQPREKKEAAERNIGGTQNLICSTIQEKHWIQHLWLKVSKTKRKPLNLLWCKKKLCNMTEYIYPKPMANFVLIKV